MNLNRIEKALPVLLLALTAVLFAEDLSGTYSGIMKAGTPEGPREERGTIVIKQSGEKLAVTAGPTAEEQYPAAKVERNGELLGFEVTPPGEPVKTLRFEVTVRAGKIAGKVSSSSGGQSLDAQIEFTKQ
jgi:hypothetical protein